MKGPVIWRICFNGNLSLSALPYGSTLGPGRWHVPPPLGLPIVYAASSRSLAQLEKRVHANGVAPVSQALIRLELPTNAVVLDAKKDLALQWPRCRSDEGYTQGVGTDWLHSNASLGLWVPSIVEPQECNLLINPAHPQYAAIAVDTEMLDFEFDPRLF